MMFAKTLLCEDIKRIIPHRYPFLMIDRVEDIKIGESCKAYKNVTSNEWFFEGHFPNYPIMPGILIVEAMAQAAGVLAFSTLIEEAVCQPESSDYVYFTSIENAKFKKPVIPGDILRLTISIKQRRGNKFWKFNAQAFVGENLTDEADFGAMIAEG
jgi:3-hydroxyacyl-[acyl-carrier-protein] dehydratase